MKFLVDTSALVRILRRQVHPAWYDLADRGLLAVCEPVISETLMIADAKTYQDLERTITQTYVVATVPDGIWTSPRRSAGISLRTAPTGACQ